MEAPTPPAENGTPTTPSSNDKATIAKLSVQLKRLNDANAKYKNLLKLAKERIQSQDEEVQSLKSDKEALEERLIADEKEAAKHIDLDETSRKSNNNAAADNAEINIVRVCQRIRGGGGGAVDDETIWALMELEKVLKNDDVVVQPAYKEWIRFDTESELHDYIRRDTGEPLQLPPYSLSPEQSARIQQEAATQVSRITEDFRRFRVKSELARKQADAQIRDLQSHQARSAAQRIEQGGTSNSGSTPGAAGGAGGGAVVERLKAEMAAQEAHWKESYDALLKENQALQSAGSEALLAAQWRQRYETCVREKEQLQMRLDNGNGTSAHYPAANGGGTGGDDKYEAKYRDLKGKVFGLLASLESSL